MSFDNLQQKNHYLNNRDLIITPYVLNKELIIIEKQFLKTSRLKLFYFNVEQCLISNRLYS